MDLRLLRIILRAIYFIRTPIISLFQMMEEEDRIASQVEWPMLTHKSLH